MTVSAARPTTSDLGIRRPVIGGFNPDPSICAVDGGYLLVTSSFEYFPGVPIYFSDDLRSWQLVGNVMSRRDQLDTSAVGASQGIYAPTVRQWGGRLWMITTSSPRFDTQMLVHAGQAEGPWSPAILIHGLIGIDPDIAWDEDGVCYVTYSGFDPGTFSQAIWQARVEPFGGTVLSEPQRIWSGTGGAYPEGPHLYRTADWWYLMISEGGTERGHSITIARSRRPDGPFVAAPLNPVMTMRGLPGVVQNTGHGDLVQREDGSWAMVFLGVRSRGGSPTWHGLGRETFAVEVEWQHGWPVPTAAIEPAERRAEALQIDFAKGDLGAEWVTPSGGSLEFASRSSRGLRIRHRAAQGHPSTILVQRLRHQRAQIRTSVLVDPESAGGLILSIDDRHAYSVEVADGAVIVVAQVGDLRVVVASSRITADRVTLGIDVVDAAADRFVQSSDAIVFTCGTNQSQPGELARLDGRYVTSEVAGGFTGRMFGYVARAGVLTVETLTYDGADLD